MTPSSTFIFYLCIDFIAVSLIACADSMVSERRRSEIQAYRKGMLLRRNVIFTAHHLCFVISFLVLFIVAALRDHVGIDYNLYASTYVNINSGHSYGYYDNWLSFGYVALCRFLGIFAPRNYEVMFAVVAFLTLYFLYKAIYKMSCSWWLSLCVFLCFCFYYSSFGQPRQFCAIALTTYACSFLRKNINGGLRQKKYFLLYVLLAFSIHKSALFMLVLYPCCHIRMNRRNLFTYVLILIGFHVAYDIVLWVISNTSYKNYIGSNFDVAFNENTAANSVMRLIMLVGCLLFAKSTVKRNPDTLIYYNSVIICTILTTLSVKMYLIARMTQYFYVMYIFLIPEVVKSIQSHLTSNNKKIMLFLTLLLLLVYHFIYYALTNTGARNYGVYKMMLF